jgi:hypothetical protein
MLGRDDHQKTGEAAGQFSADNNVCLSNSHSISSPNYWLGCDAFGFTRENAALNNSLRPFFPTSGI